MRSLPVIIAAGFFMVLAAEAADFVAMHDFFSRYGFPRPDKKDGAIVYRSPYTAIEFNDNSRMMRFNGHLIWMCAGASAGTVDWKISRADADKVIAPLLRSKDYAAKRKKPALVLIDPGHGGGQTGAKPESGRDEEHLTLDVAVSISDELKRLGIRSVLTRDGDTELGLPERARKIEELNADLFISVHMNSAGNLSARGLETYVLPFEGYPSTAGGQGDTKRVIGNSNDELNMILAYLIHRDTLKAAGSEDRGIKRARFDVLAKATCPAVLVECGFLSNTDENSLLQTAAYRESIGKGIASGIQHYLSLW